MLLPRSAELVDLIVLDTARSTNDILTGMPEASDFTVVVTDNQTSGRGRLGRVWTAPAGKTLAISVLLRPVLPAGEPLGIERFGWLPLIAGIAMATSVASVVPSERVSLKWPNDVLIGGRKVSGILAELLPAADAVVIGAGVNILLDHDELPVPTATSVLLARQGQNGAVGDEDDSLFDEVLSGYLTSLRELVTAFLRVGADADASGILELVTGWCSTLGQEVRVQLPGGTDLLGVATGIDPAGRLIVRRTSDGAVQTVAAGDVTHLRYE
jgi:BirA family biotin operon repressor/biotin-[acetyl-CoA-carboxylase] ligase